MGNHVERNREEGQLIRGQVLKLDHQCGSWASSYQDAGEPIECAQYCPRERTASTYWLHCSLTREILITFRSRLHLQVPKSEKPGKKGRGREEARQVTPMADRCYGTGWKKNQAGRMWGNHRKCPTQPPPAQNARMLGLKGGQKHPKSNPALLQRCLESAFPHSQITKLEVYSD